MDVSEVKRLMVPAGWLAIFTALLLLLEQLIRFVSMGVLSGSSVVPGSGPGISVVIALVVGLAVIWARGGRRARLLTIVAIVVVGLLLVQSAVLGALGLIARAAQTPVTGEVLLYLATLTLPVVALVVLLRLLPLTAGATTTPEETTPDSPAALPEKTTAPTWRPEQAAGAHWQTAGAAAAGAAAHDWGRPGEPGGWAAIAERPSLEPGGGENSRIRDPREFGPGAATRTSEPPAGRMPETAGPDPRAVAQQYASEDQAAEDEDITRGAPSGSRRQPPQWTPLDRSRAPEGPAGN